MAAHTTLLEFQLDSSLIAMPDGKTIKNNVDTTLQEFNFVLGSEVPCERGFLTIHTNQGSGDCHVMCRGHNEGLLTITVEEYVPESGEPFFSKETAKALERRMKAVLNSTKTKRLPVIKRGGAIDQYILTSDERLLEYDFDEVLDDFHSGMQQVKIAHSKSLGNLLVLDDLQNLAESDLIYTHTLMCKGEISYTDKEILILGGGDGGLLYELLQENPKHVIMIEMDKKVMDVCSKHMRSVCGDVLDNLVGPNYEIIVSDCRPVLEQYVNTGRQFDYVFGDLTDTPLSANTDEEHEIWDLMRRILNSSLKIIKPEGRVLTHGNGVNSAESLRLLEKLITSLTTPAAFKTRKAYVPSFMELWVFYEIWIDRSSNGNQQSSAQDGNLNQGESS